MDKRLEIQIHYTFSGDMGMNGNFVVKIFGFLIENDSHDWQSDMQITGASNG